MTTIAAVLFSFSIIGGSTLAVMHIKKKQVPVIFALGHGAIAAAGLILLISALAQGISGSLLIISIVLFVAAAIGGFILFSFHIRSRPLPVLLIPFHGIVAATAFVLLIIFITGGASG